MDQRRSRSANPPRLSVTESAMTHWIHPPSEPPKSPSTHRSTSPGRTVAPTSALLQDMLREKKAEKRANTTFNSRRASTVESTDGRTVQSSPAMASGWRAPAEKGRRASGVNAKGPAGAGGLGVREMEDYVSNLHKQNFDLKMELYHRRERMVALEQQVKEAQSLEAENAELQDINEQLLQELEKRDRAVEEAVAIICDLEGKIEDIEQAPTRSSTAQPESDNLTVTDDRSPASSPPPVIEDFSPHTPARPLSPGRNGIAPAVPPHLVNIATPVSNRAAQRVPSFLHSECGSTGALRSLYLSDEEERRGAYDYTPISRIGSAFRHDMMTPASQRALSDGLNSPRLSVLSESSFLSVYGKSKHLDLDEIAQEHVEEDEVEQSESTGQPEEHQAQPTAAESVQRWMDERQTPSKPSRQSTPTATGRADPTLSFQDIPEKLDIQPPAEPPSPQDTQPSESLFENIEPPTRRKRRASISLGGPIFGQGFLPPTPDTMSTIDPEAFNGSSSIITEKSLLDGSPAPIRHYSALSPTDVSHPTFGLSITQQQDVDRWSQGMDFDPAELSSLDGEPESVYAGDVVWGQYVTSAVPASGLGRDLMFNGEGIDELASIRARQQPATLKPHAPLLTPLRRSASQRITRRTSRPCMTGDTPPCSTTSRRLPQTPGWNNSATPTSTSSTPRYSTRQHPSAIISATTNPTHSRTTPSTPTTVTAPSLPRSASTALSFQLSRHKPTPPQASPSPTKRTSSLKARLFGSRPSALQGVESEAVSPSSTPPRTPRHHRNVEMTTNASRAQVQSMANGPSASRATGGSSTVLGHQKRPSIAVAGSATQAGEGGGRRVSFGAATAGPARTAAAAVPGPKSAMARDKASRR